MSKGFWTPASLYKQQSLLKSNNKLHWILSVHMWLSTSPWCSQSFFFFEWKATPLPLYFSNSMKWDFERFTQITPEYRSGHDGPTETAGPGSGLRAAFTTDRLYPPWTHVTAIAAPFSLQRKSCSEHTDSHRRSNSLPTSSISLTTATALLWSTIRPSLSPFTESFREESWGNEQVKKQAFLPSLCIGTQVAA